MTIGEYMALRQPNIFRRLTKLIAYKTEQKVRTEGIDIDRLMREVPGFYQDERLPR